MEIHTDPYPNTLRPSKDAVGFTSLKNPNLVFRKIEMALARFMAIAPKINVIGVLAPIPIVPVNRFIILAKLSLTPAVRRLPI